MYDPKRQYMRDVRVDHTPEKPCEMDSNVHDLREIRQGGDDGDADIGAKLMRDIRNMSKQRQLLIGSGIGFASGYIVTRTGKYVCIIVGVGVICLQLAGQNDYIKFNILRALSSEDIQRNESRKRRVRSAVTDFFKKVHQFLVQEPNLTSGIIGGFLIGLGFS